LKPLELERENLFLIHDFAEPFFGECRCLKTQLRLLTEVRFTWKSSRAGRSVNQEQEGAHTAPDQNSSNHN
jgi:hypothetical protein